MIPGGQADPLVIQMDNTTTAETYYSWKQRICSSMWVAGTWKPIAIQIRLKRLCDFLSASRNGHIDSLAVLIK